MKNSTVALLVIIGLSILVPVLIIVILYSPFKISSDHIWLKDLPAFNAFINSLTVIFLLMGKYFIRQGEKLWHKAFMSFALSLGVVFLISYLLYHSTNPSAIYGDTNLNGVLEHGEEIRIGNLRYFYLTLLFTHIGFSIFVVPFVLTAFYHALSGNFERHLKVVRYTWPMWMFVSSTGVLVYFMASPYYPI